MWSGGIEGSRVVVLLDSFVLGRVVRAAEYIMRHRYSWSYTNAYW